MANPQRGLHWGVTRPRTPRNARAPINLCDDDALEHQERIDNRRKMRDLNEVTRVAPRKIFKMYNLLAERVEDESQDTKATFRKRSRKKCNPSRATYSEYETSTQLQEPSAQEIAQLDTQSQGRTKRKAVPRTKGPCEHGVKYRSQCKVCGACPHGKQRSVCKECGGAGICMHGRRRTQCKECGGGSICEHGRQRSKCKECGGGGICEHGRERYYCKECGGSQICTTIDTQSQELPAQKKSEEAEDASSTTIDTQSQELPAQKKSEEAEDASSTTIDTQSQELPAQDTKATFRKRSRKKCNPSRATYSEYETMPIDPIDPVAGGSSNGVSRKNNLKD